MTPSELARMWRHRALELNQLAECKGTEALRVLRLRQAATVYGICADTLERELVVT